MRIRVVEQPCTSSVDNSFVRYGVIATGIAEASIDGRRLRSRERI